MVTPVANRRISVRNLSGSTAGLSEVPHVAGGMVSTLDRGSADQKVRKIQSFSKPTSSRPADAYRGLAR
jgi:hypothetical protein